LVENKKRNKDCGVGVAEVEELRRSLSDMASQETADRLRPLGLGWKDGEGKEDEDEETRSDCRQWDWGLQQ
jgi:hypothetical protein